MQTTATFHFHGSLNDFLRRPKRNGSFAYTFSAHQTVKDIIEAIGVPHVEVREVLVNGTPADLNHRLQAQDDVQVYPYDDHENDLLTGIAERRFVLDVHLGTLARSLRMLGFDTVYENTFTDNEIAGIAQAEQRIVLTRDVGLLKQKAIPVGYWLRSQQTEVQLIEVAARFNLMAHLRPFSRCMVCNGAIVRVNKHEVTELLPPRTRHHFDEFYQCANCRRVYWKGSHYERMQNLVNQLRSSTK